MTPEQQEMLVAVHAAKDSGFKRVEIAPEDLIALLDRVAALERDVDVSNKARGQDIERIKRLMQSADEAESAWQAATGCETAGDAHCRIAELEQKIEDDRCVSMEPM